MVHIGEIVFFGKEHEKLKKAIDKKHSVWYNITR